MPPRRARGQPLYPIYALGARAGCRVAGSTAGLALIIGALLTLGAAGAVRAAEIEPDRPDVSESAKLVPRGAFQLETGIAFSRESKAGERAERRAEVEAELRIGVTRQFELDLRVEPFVRLRDSEEDTGHGDIALGFKYRFVEAFEGSPWPPDLAVKPFVKLPVADAPIGTGRPDFGLLLLATFELPSEFELEVNVGGVAVGQTRPNGYLGQALVSASLSRDLIAGLSGFAELFFNSAEERDGRDHLGFNTGLVYRLTRKLALDVAVQTSLLGQGPDYVFRAGVSVLFGR